MTGRWYLTKERKKTDAYTAMSHRVGLAAVHKGSYTLFRTEAKIITPTSLDINNNLFK
jgi:hypothetical protein